MQITEKFARYEFKYVLNRHQSDEVEREVSNFMRYDGHVDPKLDNRYLVRSLYFDNLSATNYYEKIDGIKERRKFRIRTYSRDESDEVPIFLEEKGRHNQRTFKNRVEIDRDIMAIALDPMKRWHLLKKFPDVGVIERFVFDCERRHLLPRVLVDYTRRPYVSNFDLNFRVTFDSHVCAAPSKSLFLRRGDGMKECRAGYTIVEIKFFRRIPSWFHRILRGYELHRRSISKFCIGMETCDLAKDLS